MFVVIVKVVSTGAGARKADGHSRQDQFNSVDGLLVAVFSTDNGPKPIPFQVGKSRAELMRLGCC